jgi:hypothetical protein
VTAPTHTEPAVRPDAPIAAAVVVVAAMLGGAGALAVSSVLSSDVVRLVIAAVLLVGGWLVARPAGDRQHPVTLALGSHVLRGIGTSYAVLGAYLGGLALLTASVPDAPLAGEYAGPSPTAVILLVYGLPALALLAVATTGMRAWTAGAGAILPMVVVLLMATAGAGAAAISVTMLVVAVALVVVVVRAAAWPAWADLASAAAAMATSFAFGAGTSPFGSLGATQLVGAAGTAPPGRLPTGALVVVLAGSLLLATILLLVAVARRDVAGGVLVGTIFAMPPVLLGTWVPSENRWPAEAIVALAGVPAVVALTAMIAIRIPRFRDTLVAILPTRPAERAADEPDSEEFDGDEPDGGEFDGGEFDGAELTGGEIHSGEIHSGELDSGEPADVPRPLSGALAAAACAVTVAAAAVVFVVLAMPVFGWPAWVQGAVALLVLVAAGALGYWLPANPGAAGSVVALLGLGLASPWARLLAGTWASASQTERIITGVLDLGAAVALAWFLVRRHPRPGVFAAAAYTLAGSAAAFLGPLLFNADYFTTGAPPFGSELAPVAIVALPLLLLGLAAAVAVFRGRLAAGQAVGAVAVAAAGFLPLKILVGRFTGGTVDGYAMQVTLNPFTPTDWLQTSTAFREVTGPVLVAVLVMVLLALVLATSLASRPSAALAAAVALLLLATVQSSLLTVLASGSTDDAELLGQVLGGLAALTVVIGVATAFTAARRT